MVEVRTADLAYVFAWYAGDLTREKWDHLFSRIVTAMAKAADKVQVDEEPVGSLLAFASNFMHPDVSDPVVEALERSWKAAQ